MEGLCIIINRKRLLDAHSWQLEIWKISLGVRNVADSGCLVGYVVSCRHLIIMVKYWFIYSYLREASASLSIFTPKGNSGSVEN